MSKSSVVWTALAILLGTVFTAPGQTAAARMYGFSPRFFQGAGPENYTINFTTAVVFNGELAPSESSYEYETTVAIYDPWFEETVFGFLYLNLPILADSNGDGFDDFFDTSCAVSGVSTGLYLFPVFTGNVTATWNRPAGTKDGTCVLDFEGVGPFTMAFEILEYRGTVEYTPGKTNITAWLQVSRTGAPAETFRGPLSFEKDPFNPADWLTLNAGSLTNSTGLALDYFEWEFDRYPTWPTNYSGFVEFSDGDLHTPEADYFWWLLSIDDPNDLDRDGVPDFSDAPGAKLTLARSGDGLALTVTAPRGTTWKIERAPSLDGTWTEVASVQMTSGSQTLPLPAPDRTSFWRAVGD